MSKHKPAAHTSSDPLAGLRQPAPGTVPEGDDLDELPEPLADDEALPTPPPAVVPGRLVGHRVLATHAVSNGGTMVTLQPGALITEWSHGPGFLKRAQDAGVPLEPVTE